MMRFCLMDPRPFTWDRLVWMNRQWKGIVFMDFRNENAPHFLLDLIEELQREKIAESIAPCQTFAKSFMMISPATGRKDLVLLLRELDEEPMNRLETWRNNQGEQMVMILSEYVKQYAAEFTGIGQPAKINGSDKKAEPKVDNASLKKKDRRKRNRSSKQANSEVENKPDAEMPVVSDNVEFPEENGFEEDEEVEIPEHETSDEVEIEGS